MAERQWQGGPNTVSAVGLTPGVRNARQAATALSALQLEAVLYACQRHETKQEGKRGGFFIGDGAGMGKGREIAGCLIENLLQGDPDPCTWDVERRGEFSPLGPRAGCFLALGSGLGLVGTASSRR